MGEAEMVIVEGEVVENYSTAIVPATASTHNSNRVPILHMPTAVDKVNLIDSWLTRRSADTRRNYEGHLTRFFQSFPEYDPDLHSLNDVALEFCTWPPPAVATKVEAFKAQLIADGRSNATVNAHVSAIRSLLTLATRWGLRQSDGRGLIQGEKVTPYRDTTGPDAATMRKLIAAPAKFYAEDNPLKALRDTAIMRLFCENGLRRGSILGLDVGDFEPISRKVQILLKGKGSEKRGVTISAKTTEAIYAYLQAAGTLGDAEGPLFRSLDRNPLFNNQTRLTPNGCWKVVVEYGEMLELHRHLHPHLIRHGAITLLMEELNNDVVAVQQYTMHAKIETLLIYADNLKQNTMQAKLTNMLSDLLSGEEPPAPRKRGRPKKAG